MNGLPVSRISLRSMAVAGVALTLTACSSLQGTVRPSKAVPPATDLATSTTIHPALWPKGKSGVADDPAIQAKVAELLSPGCRSKRRSARSSRPTSNSVTPADVRKYRLGSVLDGGNSGPYGNDRAAAGLAERGRRILRRLDGCAAGPSRHPASSGDRMRCTAIPTSSAPRCFRTISGSARCAMSTLDPQDRRDHGDRNPRHGAGLDVFADHRGGARRSLGPHL